ncbi:MAG: Uncharacterised protein [Polaribacter sp. SA4-10]|nr:MAG: Uncharacterised protein [Polaribacter sp. SA4-10]
MITSPAFIFALSITSERFSLAVTVESTIIVRTKSPTSAVSPPVEWIVIPKPLKSFINSSVPFIITDNTSPGILLLLRPIVEDNMILSVAPTHNKSSIFIIKASCAIPFHTEISPVSFQYMYAKEDFVPAPSACIIKQ